jgi:uncharacterized protein
MNDLNTKEVSDICVSCGMCCDGTLFKKAILSDSADLSENINKAKKLDLQIIIEDEKYFFKQPCHLFNKCCTVYDKTRPQICGTFFCLPIRRYERNELDLITAEKQIKVLFNLKNDINKLSYEFKEFLNLTFYSLSDKIDKIMVKSDPDQLKKFGKLILINLQFRKLKKEYFQKKSTD